MRNARITVSVLYSDMIGQLTALKTNGHSRRKLLVSFKTDSFNVILNGVICMVL